MIIISSNDNNNGDNNSNNNNDNRYLSEMLLTALEFDTNFNKCWL